MLSTLKIRVACDFLLTDMGTYMQFCDNQQHKTTDTFKISLYNIVKWKSYLLLQTNPNLLNSASRPNNFMTFPFCQIVTIGIP